MSMQPVNHSIFAHPDPTVEAEYILTLTREVDTLHVDLHAMMELAPSEDDDTLFVKKEDWCQQWTCFMEQAVPVAENISREQLEKDSKDAEVEEELEEDQMEKDGDYEEEQEKEEALIKRLRHIYRARTNTRHVESEANVETPAVPIKIAEQVVKKKEVQTPRMSVAQKPVNAVPYERCVTASCTCYRVPIGIVCTNCKRLKAACSLVAGKGKKKQTPPTKPTSASKSILDSSSTTASPLPQARPAPMAAKGKSRVEDVPTVALEIPWPAPGP
ncbi:uncharacterized protein EDB93DRAFT_1255574 [Suillus bovinus]|uniref:uncharacterized protein n=1 Tax=Suillus bovinus TaxID=48563 RepID=UPI001B8666ED|nr:uncharacterized protein EDB93DRAFT_1255574 [Suillus bovinus]KAG2131309.1 hypothetical protein EDB93DRAFT_1255574 [Suillus bovinus]